MPAEEQVMEIKNLLCSVNRKINKIIKKIKNQSCPNHNNDKLSSVCLNPGCNLKITCEVCHLHDHLNHTFLTIKQFFHKLMQQVSDKMTKYDLKIYIEIEN